MTTLTADPFATEAATRFRAEVRDWLQRELPPTWGTDEHPELPDEAAEVAFLRDWQRRLHGGGWAGLSWPEEYGGAGAGLVEQVIFAEERDRARAPIDIGIVGTQMVGPMLIAHGTEEQKRELLPRILSGEDLWCQGFSEPEAGSDLASLRTRAVAVDGGWRIDGQKVWTSRAQYAEQMILLARTDPDAPAHKGITAFVVPMTAAGLTIREIRQINGSTEFCEVFCDSVEVPDSAVVGAVDAGWDVAISTLSFERFATTRAFEMRRLVCDLVEAHPELLRAEGGLEPSPLGVEITRHAIDAHAAGVTFTRMVGAIAARGEVGADASATKLATTELGQRIVATAVSASADTIAAGPVNPRVGGPVAWDLELTNGVKNTIAAGTSQIQRNILGERVLGLPRPGSSRPPAGAGPVPRPFADATLAPEVEEFVATLRKALASVHPVEAVIAAAEVPDEPAGAATWAALVDLGCTAMGAGAEPDDLLLAALATAEGGHALLSGELLGHALALRALARTGRPAADVAAAMTADGRRATTTGARATGLRLDEDGRLGGEVTWVLEPEGADLVVAWATGGPTGRCLVAVAPTHPAVTVRPTPTYDPTRRFGTVVVDGLATDDLRLLVPVAVGDVPAEAPDRAAADAALLVSADSLGSARRALDEAIAYACERHQFGAPIGSFQALKHLLVDAHVKLEQARAAVFDACTAPDRADVRFAVHAARAAAAEAHLSVAATAIQTFGGIGFTREVTAHLHMKRARVSEHLAGTAADHRAAAARHVTSVLAAWSTSAAAHHPSPVTS